MRSKAQALRNRAQGAEVERRGHRSQARGGGLDHSVNAKTSVFSGCLLFRSFQTPWREGHRSLSACQEICVAVSIPQRLAVPSDGELESHSDGLSLSGEQVHVLGCEVSEEGL